MAWNKPNKSKYNISNNTKDKIISNERLKIIESRVPEEIQLQNTLTENYSNRVKTLTEKSKEHAAALMFVRDLSNQYNYRLSLKIFDNDYKETLLKIYESIIDVAFTFDILLEVINDIVIDTYLFAFRIMKNENNKSNIIITPISIWENKEQLHPIKYTQLLPDWLIEEDDNIYTIVDDITIAEARIKMLNDGFIENQELHIGTRKWN